VYKIPLAWLFPSYWGMSALSSTVNLNLISPHVPGAQLDPFWDQTSMHWLMNIIALVILGLVFLCVSWWRLVRLTPGRRK
jgi:hypothetical protein